MACSNWFVCLSHVKGNKNNPPKHENEIENMGKRKLGGVIRDMRGSKYDQNVLDVFGKV